MEHLTISQFASVKPWIWTILDSRLALLADHLAAGTASLKLPASYALLVWLVQHHGKPDLGKSVLGVIWAIPTMTYQSDIVPGMSSCVAFYLLLQVFPLQLEGKWGKPLSWPCSKSWSFSSISMATMRRRPSIHLQAIRPGGSWKFQFPFPDPLTKKNGKKLKKTKTSAINCLHRFLAPLRSLLQLVSLEGC